MGANAVEVARIFRYLLDAVSDFEKWPQFLEKLSQLFGADGANLMYFDFSENKLAFSMQHGYDHISISKLEQLSVLFPDDPRIVYAMQHMGMPVTCRQCVDEQTLHESRVYKEFLKPEGIEYTMGVHFMGDGMGYALSVMRGQQGQPFNTSDTELLSELIPSIKQGIDLHKRLAILDFEKQTALETLNSMKLGMVLMGEGGLIIFVNNTALDISGDNDGFRIVNERIVSQSPDDAMKISNHVNKAIVSARNGEIIPAEGLSIARTSGARPYDVVISTIWSNHLRFGLGHLNDPVAVLYITDPDRPQEAPPEILQRLYGLTPAESRVVELLVAGQTVAEISENLSISKHTAREHLAVAFEKTGTSRQAELVKRILSSQAWIASSQSSGGQSSGKLSAPST